METIDVLESYSNRFRELINNRQDGLYESEDRSIKDLFCLKAVEDWNYICVSMDIVDQANAAIRNFLLFGLDGPTKYEDVGERFLRLYGVLNATYIQQEAIKQICKRFGLEADEEVKAIPIRDIRNKIGAHNPEQGSNKRAHLTGQVSLSGFKCSYGHYETTDEQRTFTSFPSEDIDLKERVEEHCRTIIDILDRTYEELVKRFWEEDDSQYEKHRTELEDLRIEKDGGEVLRSGGGKVRMPAKGRWTGEVPLRDRVLT